MVQILQGLSLISTLEPEMSDPLPGQTFIRAAVKSHKKCNNLTEIMFETAMIRAEIMDRDLQYKGPSVLSNKPLYGVPVSIKDQLDVEGYDSCMGYSAKVDRPATHNAIIVQVLLHAGAIPFVKTNVPQTLLSFECGNPVWGATCNPFSSVHTSGGSSGGEAALLASDGAAVGIGSDIGGSWSVLFSPS